MANIDDGDFFFARPPVAVRPRDPWEKAMFEAQMTLALATLLSVVVLIMVSASATHAREATEFSMEVSDFAGLDLNATLGGTASSSFALKARVENRRILQPCCYHGGEVVVSYSGVALAWSRVPRFCVRRVAPAAEFRVLSWGREIGLPEDLRRRLASDCRMGTARIVVEMKVFNDDKGMSSSGRFNGPSLRSFQLMLRSRQAPD
ncbi:hypothetical protein GQ55_5G184800 [Panicum hallii var. hallii]|uniref:Late embryogenesis abundant protein LEA-2 subgroup domain-containing protein n=1 Tax=Panicum hallii var. hallii TaxID=1504633 RepID=A0A2T7DHP5_9POAL|nr:hypothetical protein GQ55_5G184800 [Panicum hallii var. hallii]